MIRFLSELIQAKETVERKNKLIRVSKIKQTEVYLAGREPTDTIRSIGLKGGDI